MLGKTMVTLAPWRSQLLAHQETVTLVSRNCIPLRPDQVLQRGSLWQACC